jgi:hypothetical protein
MSRLVVRHSYYLGAPASSSLLAPIQFKPTLQPLKQRANNNSACFPMISSPSLAPRKSVETVETGERTPYAAPFARPTLFHVFTEAAIGFSEKSKEEPIVSGRLRKLEVRLRTNHHNMFRCIRRSRWSACERRSKGPGSTPHLQRSTPAKNCK